MPEQKKNNPMMASLELFLWRPTPQKPDIAGGSPTPDGSNNSMPESFKTMFLVDPESEHTGPAVFKQNGGCAFEGWVSHEKAPASNSESTSESPQSSSNQPPPTVSVFKFTQRITMSTVTESALSFKLAMWWRPTPQKPDICAGEPGDVYEGAFRLGPADQVYDEQLNMSNHANCSVNAQLVQRGYSATARILELTITVNLPW